MREINHHWTAGRVRKHLCVRFWRFGNPLRELWRWLTGQRHRPVSIVPARGGRGNDFCYCPTGRTTEFRVELFGWGFWGWLSRDTTRRPCVCEQIVEAFVVRTTGGES